MTKYIYRIRPRPYQVRALRTLLKNGYGGALLMAPRTGKTKVAVDYAGIMSAAGRFNRVLIVSPNRVMGTWAKQISNNCAVPHEIVVWDARLRRTLKQIPSPSPHTTVQFVIINYEAFGTPGKPIGKDRFGRIKRSRSTGGRFTTRKQILRWVGTDDGLCILDESHKIKSASGRAASMIVRFQPVFKYRVILTGTPVTKAKRAHDVYMQWKFLNPARFADWPTVDDFKTETGRWIDRNGYPQWVGARPRGMEVLRDRVHADAFVVTRQEAGLATHGEPDVELVSVPLSPAVGRVYDEMAEEMVARLKNGEIAEASIKLVQALRLAQITSGFAKTDTGKMYRIGREKLNALEDYLDDANEHDEKLVIVARFKPDLRAIAKLCRDKFGIPTFEMRGGVKVSQSDVDLQTFHDHDGCAAYVVQPQAGSLGVDMQTAPRMIWYSMTTSWVDYTQVNDRNALFAGMRTQTYLLGKSTVDEVIYKGLQLDGDVAKYITRRPESLLRTDRVS